MNSLMKGGRTDNCLSFIKILAAIQVMFGHCVEHLELPVPDWISVLIGYFRGVPIFFIISGFLIWFSMERSSSYSVYIKKRFWRIYPELWLAVIIEIITILLLYHGWNIRHLVAFTITQGSFFQFWTPDSLRGYGCGTPNGTLWTICVMIQFYIIAWPIRTIMHKKKWTIWLIGFIACLGISGLGQLVFEKIGSGILLKLFEQTVLRYLWLFYMGCFIAEYSDKAIPVLKRIWYLLLIIGIVPYITGIDLFVGYYVLWSLLLVAGLIGFAYRFPQLSIHSDISYGLFLFHMIVVNIFISVSWIGNWWNALAALLISGLCAYVSYVTVGKWASRRKRKLV